MTDITLPDNVWDDVEPGTEGLLDEWLVQPGTAVKKGQSVAIVVIVKTSVEVAAPEDGVLGEIVIQKDDTVAKGAVIGRLKAA
ncbi:lipoyl domain-containing protein [Ampullimonas aquatilis]|uniref:lipoyl domain-containing protein n=1 Tax=Ampullimonas aquatilis TaxID=1341549 RepID=UPI003C761C61